MSTLELQHVTKSFDGPPVVKDLSLSLEDGGFLAVLGPSGCGKTTMLRIIAGLEKADSGRIVLDGKRIDNVPVHKRNIGMVFQSYALFPHLTVYRNIAYGLEMRGTPPVREREAVRNAIRLVRLDGYENRKPNQLSGGQQQRVALARALVIEPRLLLLDESLSALDKRLREEMQVELRELQKKLGVTTVFVTHDKDEALTMADTVAVMKDGEIAQIGNPIEMYERPRSPFVAEFLGDTNVIHGRLQSSHARWQMHLENGEILPLHGTPPAGYTELPQDRVFSIRPERVRSLSGSSAETPDRIAAEVVSSTYTGNLTRYRVNSAGREFLVTVQNEESPRALEPGSRIFLQFPFLHLVGMDDDKLREGS